MANRVSVIERHTDPCDLKHVPTQLNPADAITRSLITQVFLDSCDRWLSGPEFLWLSSEHWPQISLLPVEFPLELTHCRPDVSVKTCFAFKTVSPKDKCITLFLFALSPKKNCRVGSSLLPDG